MSRIALWFNYSLTRAVLLFADMYADHGVDIDVRSHVLVLGPLAFAVMWKRPTSSSAPTEGDKR